MTQPTTARPRFPPAGPFHLELKRQVEAHFAQAGRSPRATWAMRAKTALMFGWLAGSWALLMFGGLSLLPALLVAVSLGLAMAGIGFDVMHDANHGSYSDDTRVNRLLAFSLDLIGGSSYLWRHKHNVLHHTYPNVVGQDTDGDAGPSLRLNPAQPHHALHRFQHLYAWVLYGVFALKWWFADDFRELAAGKIGSHRFPRPRGAALAGLLGGKALFFTWAFLLPLVVHPTWALVPIWLVVSATVGITLATVFQLAHCVGEAEHPEPAAGALLPDWAALQLATTVDFARGNRLLGWYLGGLNFQVEHHLFPKICHVHYPELAVIVERTCKAHGMPYLVQPTLRAALAANVRYLRELGRGLPARAKVLTVAPA